MLMSPLDEPMSDGEDKHSATTPLLINNPRLSTKASCCHNKTKHFHKNSHENNQGYEDEKSHNKVLKDRNVQEVVCCNDETTSETNESFIEQGANH